MKKRQIILIFFGLMIAFFARPSPANANFIPEIRENYIAALQLFALQMTDTMVAQVEAVGMMLDAKHQLETQRLFQEMSAQAHKDYHPSEQMCTFGTFTRALASTERVSNLTRTAIAQNILQRESGNGDSVGRIPNDDIISRIAQFRKSFCDPGDNGNGLHLLCPAPPPAPLRNRDINFSRVLDQPLSLNIDLLDPAVTSDEEAVFALSNNLFSHDIFERLPENEMDKDPYQIKYANQRSVMAMRGIARNSIASIIAQKTAMPIVAEANSVAPYLKALLMEFGLTPDEVVAIIGENPSYYAQMELLTKKIYQNPKFYTNLYDKPVNVQRIRAAMKAVKLMQDRDIQAAMMRREMLMSLILEVSLREKANNTYSAVENQLYGEDQ